MSTKANHGVDEDKATEAKNLAKEGLEAIQQGDKDEGKFLIDAAKDLDKEAAGEVLKEKPAKGSGK